MNSPVIIFQQSDWHLWDMLGWAGMISLSISAVYCALISMNPPLGRQGASPRSSLLASFKYQWCLSVSQSGKLEWTERSWFSHSRLQGKSSCSYFCQGSDVHPWVCEDLPPPGKVTSGLLGSDSRARWLFPPRLTGLCLCCCRDFLWRTSPVFVGGVWGARAHTWSVCRADGRGHLSASLVDTGATCCCSFPVFSAERKEIGAGAANSTGLSNRVLLHGVFTLSPTGGCYLFTAGKSLIFCIWP